MLCVLLPVGALSFVCLLAILIFGMYSGAVTSGSQLFKLLVPSLIFVPILGFAFFLVGVAISQYGKRLMMLVPRNLSKKVTSNRSPRVARVVHLVGIVLGSIGFIASIGCGVLYQSESATLAPIAALLPSAGWLGCSLLGAVIGAGGGKLVHTSLQLLQPTAGELQVQDHRRPVVFLRSFHDEEADVVLEEHRDKDNNYSVRRGRLEEAISDQFGPFGPFVAIGKPGEKLPHLGAARNYYSDAEWHTAVTAWLEQALLIVLFAGVTTGLRWELEAISRAGCGHKLLILMPPTEQDRRWKIVRQALESTPAFGQLPASMPKGALALHSVPGGEPVVITASNQQKLDFDNAIMLALYGMFCREKPNGQK
jgi:hypothetical protein